MKRNFVCVMSTALLVAWSAGTRAEADEQKRKPADGGDVAEAIAEGATTEETKRRFFEMLFGKESGEQSPLEAATQPWQTSWESFCDELQRVYAQGVPPGDTIDALFAGKQVTWEGHIAGLDAGKRTIALRMPDCHVTVTGAGGKSATVLLPGLFFENQAEMNQSLQQIGLGNPETWQQQAWQRKDAYELFSQKVRFTATLEPVDLVVDNLPAVSWEHITDEKDGVERNQISVYTGHAKLLGSASALSR